MPTSAKDAHPRVGLFITCLVDLFRPNIGFAAARLLEAAGCHVEVPRAQTCCGQPAYNAGDRNNAAAIARQVVSTFDDFDYVVAPSGSCAGMIRVHYPALLTDDPQWEMRAQDLALRTYELVSFLTDVRDQKSVQARYEGVVTYQDGCAGLREMGVWAQPRRLLRTVAGLELREMNRTEACCGFGGTFCIKYPDISGRIVDDKCNDVLESGADTLVAGDLGCLMNLAGRLSRRGASIAVRHVAEILAGMCDIPAIGAPK